MKAGTDAPSPRAVRRLRLAFALLVATLIALLAASFVEAWREPAERTLWLGTALAGVLALALLFALRRTVRLLVASHPGLSREGRERSQMQRALDESRQRLQLLLDHMPDGVIAFDGAGRVEWINPAARLMFQCSAADIVGRPVRELIPELEIAAPPPGEPGARAPALVPRLALQGRRRDGSEFPLEAERVALRADGALAGMCVCRDLSESLQVERMKHEFVSMVSHELRTPLTSLRGSLALLADGSTIEDLPVDARRLLRLASDNSERLVHLVNDILDFEKLRAGALRIDTEPVDLGAMAQQAAEAIDGMARQAPVLIRVLPTEAELPVRADPARLMQVLANLLSNAIKYSPPHGTVLVILRRRAEWVRLEVRDQGPGVPADFAPRLFEPFAQAPGERRSRQGGTGLGLAISRALIEMMHGSIGIEPGEPGDGARFWIELPLHVDPPSTFGDLD